MKYHPLGASGLSVSAVCLGTMTFGQKDWGTDAKSSESIMDAFLAAGGNFIDTADKYADTASETIIGKWLGSKNRDDVILASKCFFPNQSIGGDAGLSRERVIKSCEFSLKRLQTDHIDLYQLHGPDPQTPIEETIEALGSLVDQGKVRCIGLCNYPAWELMKAQCIANSKALPPFTSAQYLYNLLKRDIEIEVLPACRETGAGVLCWSPLSGGMLTGKYPDSAEPPAGTRLSKRSNLTKGHYREWVEKSCNLIDKVRHIAENRQVHPSQISLAWLLSKKEVASVITGASSCSQIESNCQAADLKLREEEILELDQASARPTPYPQSWIRTTHHELFGI